MASTDSVQAITDAQPPFHPDPSRHTAKDSVVLRAKKLDFHVYWPFLSYPEGSFFNVIFKYAQPDGFKNGLPVAVLEEDDDVIRDLLLLCYPGKLPTFQTQLEGDLLKTVTQIEHISKVLKAAHKYGLESEMFSSRATDALLAVPLIETEPHRIYALGVRYHFKGVCIEAAKRSLKMDKDDPPTNYGDELDEITGRDLYVLQDYQHRARQLAWDAVFDFTTPDERFATLYGDELPFDLFDGDSLRQAGHSEDCINEFTQHGVRIGIYLYHYSGEGEHRVADTMAPGWWDEFVKDVAFRYSLSTDPKVFTDLKLINKAIERVTKQCRRCKSNGLAMALRLSDWTNNVFEREVKDSQEDLELKLSF